MDPEFLKLQSLVDVLLYNRETIAVLEAGCGHRSYVRMPENAHIVGIDISESELRRNAGLHERIVGDIESYGLPYSAYDVIVCWWVLEHLSHPRRALDNFRRAIKDDGIIILAIPNVWSIKGLVTKCTPYWFHVWAYRKLRHISDATPFPTFLRFSISPQSISRYALRHNLAILYASLYQSPEIATIIERNGLLRAGWRAIRQAAAVLTFGKVDVALTEYIVVLTKQKRPAPIGLDAVGTQQRN